MELYLKRTIVLLVMAFSLHPLSAQSMDELKRWLAMPDRPVLEQQSFAKKALSAAEAEEAGKLLSNDEKKRVLTSDVEEWKGTLLKHNDYSFKFAYCVFGEKPADGRSLYISLHGGGGAPPDINDQQWENQKRLYKPAEGVYVAPRAPTDTWNMWHQEYMDYFLDRLIRLAIVFADVNPEKVYILGYSAGGDGLYQLAPRMADRWAASAMMAGHPGDASPLNLLNLPFAIYMGGLDKAYDRNILAKKWELMLDSLQKNEGEGYIHDVHIYPDKPHWMDRRDTIAIPWMAKFKRNSLPEKIIWRQDDVLEQHLYWLSVPQSCMKAGNEIIADYNHNTVRISKCDSDTLIINLNDKMVDLDKPVCVMFNSKKIFCKKVIRSIVPIGKTIKSRGDDSYIFSAQLAVIKGKKVIQMK